MTTNRRPPPLAFLCLVSVLCLLSSPSLASSAKRHYVVYLGGHNHGGSSATEADLQAVTDSHHDLLATHLGDMEKAKNAIRYSYTRHINGFTAVLDAEEAARIAKHPGVVSVFPDRMKKLHTTNSWDFMLLNKEIEIPSGKLIKVPSEIWKAARFGENVIIGNLDSGVWPESKSFNDKGYGPIPAKWKGLCENNTKIGVSCNRKLIGSRLYNKGFIEDGSTADPADLYNPRDMDGHGSHTLSTAGGNFVPGVDILSAAGGVAKGGAPRARVAAYKVCFVVEDGTSCADSDILAGFDAAIADGVDVLSVSLGSEDFADYSYLADGLAIGSFHAVRSGVVVVASAGNSGPVQGTVANFAPWIVTVGASTTDRNIDVHVELGKGTALFQKPLPDHKQYKLASAADVKLPNATAEDAILCLPGTLDPTKAQGKILACLRGKTARVDKSRQAKNAGAIGVILCNDEASGIELVDDIHYVPTSHVVYKDGVKVFRYINGTKNPTAYIAPPVTTYGNKPAPSLAAFSSRGPNVVTPQILKPDVAAPGVNILAAYTMAGDDESRKYPYQLESGTSMACPHVAGVAALVKAVHPDWSPSAVHSAIMTTARTRGNTGDKMNDLNEHESSSFGYGAGHIRPNRAIKPGLVYEVAAHEYLELLCSIGYNSSDMGELLEKGYKCPKKVKSVFDHNYPSFSVPNLGSGPVTFKRRVKNVGPPGVYAAEVKEPYGVAVKVVPDVLKFDKYGEEKSFKVMVAAKWKGAAKGYEFGGLTWTDGDHYVRSPIFVTDNLVIDQSNKIVGTY
ncbi:unnamed protein product [Linum tenue]|uniref:Uncharacterized protein n=1 Tax=Linum tenue TaxID=586396 RepID=A0AAV0M286_9ROSI|nr:unnamed protein product [Linum tenue]